MYNQKEKILFVIPAEPGFYIVTPWRDKQNGKLNLFSLEPVTGWLLNKKVEGGDRTPITYEVRDKDDSAAILHPNGEVHRCGRVWENLHAWLEECRWEDLL